MRLWWVVVIAATQLAAQTSKLDLARETALSYAKSLPDFICTEIVQRVSMTGRFVQSADRLTIQLTYFGQQENYKLLAINGAATDRTFESLDGLLTGGEFGTTLVRIFDPASAAEFQPKGATQYAYRVKPANSHYTLGYRTDSGELRIATVGQEGVVTLDKKTSKVLRLTAQATDIPKDFAILAASTTTEYAFVQVAGGRHLLPVRAESEMLRGNQTTRNAVTFTAYRKFSADSTIDFGTGEKKK
jgi:hypothetical protein